MTAELPQGRDLLAEATNGRLHWNDPGMDEFERGWEPFVLDSRVEVRVNENETNERWLKGKVVETVHENDRMIVVLCDEQWHTNLDFYNGRGTAIMVMLNTRRGILSRIRLIEEVQQFSTPTKDATSSDNVPTNPLTL